MGAIVCALTGPLACQGSTEKPPESAPVAPGAVATPIGPGQFPRVAHQALLSTDRSAKEKLRLSGVVQHQLSRARRLFEEGHERAAEDVAVGALLLLRQDDALSAALSGQEQALLLAAHAAARSGASGRAAAFYERVLALDPEPEVKVDVEQHLAALVAFRQANAGRSKLMRAGEAARYELSRATIEPSQDAYRSAASAVIDWMKAALESSALSRSPESMADREEALEAYQAIRTGAPALISLCLRQGQPFQAVELLSQESLSRALPGGARGLLTEAGKKNDPEAWLSLFQMLDAARRNEAAEGSLPGYLADAGTLWSSIGLYRAGAGELQYAMPLSMMLLEFGMPEVATTVLAQTVGPDTSPEALAWSLSLAMRAMLELGQTDQIEAARVSFKEAHKLMALAQTKLPEDAESARSLHLMLANLEIRFGNTERALPLLAEASDKTARASTWLRLAEVTHQVEGPKSALLALDRASRAAQMQGDVLNEARIALVRFDVQRALGNEEGAEEALLTALQRTMTARAMDLPQVPKSAVERVLGRILEYSGNQSATRRAFGRALEASRRNATEISFTLSEMARSALSTGDVRLSREATKQALSFNIESDDLVYIALWQWLVERRAGGYLDQMPRAALADASDVRGWVAQLRLFGLGELDRDQLLAAAETKVERTEAEFYVALAGETEDRALLEKVARSSAIDLVEVHIARDLLAPPLEVPWPAGVEVP